MESLTLASEGEDRTGVGAGQLLAAGTGRDLVPAGVEGQQQVATRDLSSPRARSHCQASRCSRAAINLLNQPGPHRICEDRTSPGHKPDATGGPSPARAQEEVEWG